MTLGGPLRVLLAPVMDHGHPVHASVLGQVVRDRIVHGDAIVPHGHIAGPPAPAHLILRLVHMIGQQRLQGVGFIGCQPGDVGNESLVEIEELAAGDGMFRDQRPDVVSETRNTLIELLRSRTPRLWRAQKSFRKSPRS